MNAVHKYDRTQCHHDTRGAGAEPRAGLCLGLVQTMSTLDLIREMDAMEWDIELLRKYERLYLELELHNLIAAARLYCDSCKNTYAAYHARPENANARFYCENGVVGKGFLVADSKRKYNEMLDRFEALLKPEPDWDA